MTVSKRATDYHAIKVMLGCPDWLEYIDQAERIVLDTVIEDRFSDAALERYANYLHTLSQVRNANAIRADLRSRKAQP